MAQGLQHDRLMRASHSHVAAAARDENQENHVVAMRLIQQPATYTEWENRHSKLMQQVCQPKRLRQQIVQMRATTLALVHRRAIFEYLRDAKITGANRHKYIELFYGSRDYASSLIIEHGHYIQSWVSGSCSRYIGTELLHDPAYEAPLSAYEQWYGEYFRTFCNLQLSTGDSVSNECERDLLPMLKERAIVARERLLHLR